jgi:hypothetical protein
MAPTSALALALERAKDDARTLPPFPRADGVARRRRVAMGDPQAPTGKVLEVLDAHGLLGDDGRLAPDVFVVSMGDHFDFGGRAERRASSENATEVLAWLAAHPSDQVVILAGNHDLARVGELARFDDASFQEAQTEADAGYWDKAPARSERDFRARWGTPSWELVARDFGGFKVEQRTLVTALLQTGRLGIAYADGSGLLLTHAGVTLDELDALDVPADARVDASAVAASLNAAFAAAARAYTGGPFAIPHLHQPGDASAEGRGMFYHRPARIEGDVAKGTLRRRFDVRRLPPGLTQGIGHIRDKKTRQLLGVPPDDARSFALRSLRVKGDAVTYARGVFESARADEAVVLFLDGAMNDATAAEYELLDLDSRSAAQGKGAA